jgi:hypothetical protein
MKYWVELINKQHVFLEEFEYSDRGIKTAKYFIPYTAILFIDNTEED